MSRRPAPVPGVVRGRPHYAYVIVLIGLLNVLGAQGFLRFGYTMILPGMREAMDLDFTQTGMLATANYVGYIAAALALGWLVVRFGSRLTIGVGATTVGVAMFLTGLAPNYEVALALQLVAGAAGVAATSPSLSLATAWFARHRRGLAAGAMASGGPLGSLIVGPLIPFMILSFGAMGWRYGWFVLGTAMIVFGLLALALLRDRPADVGLAPLGASPDDVAPADAPGPVNWGLVYGSPLVWHLAVLALLSTLGAIGFTTFFTSYLIEERSITAETAGRLWALAGVAGVVGGFLWGAISDRLGRKQALIGSYAVHALCFGLFATDSGLPVFALCAFLFGITSRANYSVMAAYCGDLLGPRLGTAAFGINNIFAGVGLAVGPALAGFVADATASFALAFWGSAGVALLGALGAAALPSARRSPMPDRRSERA